MMEPIGKKSGRSIGWWACIFFGCLFIVGAVAAVVPPYYFLYTLRSAYSLPEKLEIFSSLCRSGPLGKENARRYAAKQFNGLRGYGAYFVLGDSSIWIGETRDGIMDLFGTPDTSNADSLQYHYGNDVLTTLEFRFRADGRCKEVVRADRKL